MGGPPLEFINIQPQKGGPPLKFINIQPPKMGSASRIQQNTAPKMWSVSRIHQHTGLKRESTYSPQKGFRIGISNYVVKKYVKIQDSHCLLEFGKIFSYNCSMEMEYRLLFLNFLNFIYSKKAKKFCKISTNYLTGST